MNEQEPWQTSTANGRQYRIQKMVNKEGSLFWVEELVERDNGDNAIFVDFGMFKNRTDAEKRFNEMMAGEGFDTTGFMQHVVKQRTN